MAENVFWRCVVWNGYVYKENQRLLGKKHFLDRVAKKWGEDRGEKGKKREGSKP